MINYNSQSFIEGLLVGGEGGGGIFFGTARLTQNTPNITHILIGGLHPSDEPGVHA